MYSNAANFAVDPLREWKTSQILEKPILHLAGYSRAADATFFFVPELHLALDAGQCRGRQYPFIFLTHGHSDHSADLPWLLTRENNVICYCPEEVVPFINDYVRAKKFLSASSKNIPISHYTLQGVKENDVFFTGKQNQLKVEVIKCHHSVPCVGYLFSEKRNKLKSEYVGHNSKELAQLRKNGINISEQIYGNLFAYIGDTAIDVFYKNEKIFDYPTIIVECTFLKDEEWVDERCKRDGHIAWKSLEPIILAHPKNKFILIHFSCRYSLQEIYDFFDNLVTRKENPLDLQNVILHATDENTGEQ